MLFFPLFALLAIVSRSGSSQNCLYPNQESLRQVTDLPSLGIHATTF